MSGMRFVRQPGPPAACRAVVVPAGAVAIEAELPPGVRLLDAVSALLPRFGAESACLSLHGGGFGPFGYVIPALSPDGTQAAFYSRTFRPAGISRLDMGAMTLGFREGEPFFHCHASWTEADGHAGCGHVLPDETVVAAPITVRGAGLVGARFTVRPDPETGFSLFGPVATEMAVPGGLRRAVAVRLAPNQDLVETLEAVSQGAEFTRARVQGGVASIIEARFTNGSGIGGFATEMLVRRGVVDCHAAGSEVEIGIVDLHGTIGTGMLVRGDNPVLMTFEGVLEES